MKNSVLKKPEILDGSISTSLVPVLVGVFGIGAGAALAYAGTTALVVAIVALIMALAILLSLDALAVTMVITIHLYIDWYLGYHLVGPGMALGLLVIYYFAHTNQHTWVAPRLLWLWLLFLVITLYPAIRGGSYMLFDAASFYPSNILGAFLMCWLGAVMAQNSDSVRKFLTVFTLLATLLALHTLIQAFTGTVLFSSPQATALLSDPLVANYQLAGTNAHRAGSFFIDPNWNGTFLALSFFISLGLFIATSNVFEKIVSFLAMAMIFPALILTYSSGAVIAFFGGLTTFIFLAGSLRYRVILISIIFVASVILLTFFPDQIALQLQHATGVNELSLRIAAWQTGMQVMFAYPLFGVGLGLQAYLIHADPYRVPAQFVALAHPHNSYIEMGAMTGIPALLIFIALILSSLAFALGNWTFADKKMRPILGGGIAAIVTLTINSFSINGWTHFAISMIGWLILGIIASPALTAYLKKNNTQSVTNV